MQYIQLDNFNGNLNIVCNEDGSGKQLIFDTLKEAQDTLEENCQDGVVIPLGTNIINLLRNCEEFVSQILGEEGPENFDGTLIKELDEVLQLT